MSLAATLVRRPSAHVAALLACVLAACGGGNTEPAGTLQITNPVDGQSFNVADDTNPDLAGVQVAAAVKATHLDGKTVQLAFDGDASPASATVANGVANFTITLKTGAITATATGLDGMKVTSGAVHVTLDPATAACRIVSPADRDVLDATKDAAPAVDGFQSDVKVRCVGVELGNPVALVVNGAKIDAQPIGPGGVALFSKVELAEGANALEADTKTNAGTAVKATATVTVSTGACRVTLSPPTGTVFNARGEGQHDSVIADETPGEPMNATLTVTTDSNCVGQVEIKTPGSDPALALAVVSGTSTQVPVVLPDGVVDVRAYVTGSKKGTSPLAHYTVDAVVPQATLTFPAGGEQFDDKADRSDAPGLQIPVRGSFTGIDPGTSFDVVLEPGAPQESVQHGTLAADGTFNVLVTLADGDHSLLVRATRPSGTVATSATVSFHSVFLNASLALTSPSDGEKFPLGKDADTTTDGYQIRFGLTATNLSGATGAVQCGLASAPFTVGADGTASTVITVPDVGCAGATLTCTASLTATDGTLFTTPAVHLLVDPTPPVVTLLSPTPDAVLGSNVVPVSATTSCPGEVQQASVLRSGSLLAGPSAVADNAVMFEEVTLPTGDSALRLSVTDAAGNETDTDFHVFVDTEAPAPAFLQPLAGSSVTYGAADDEDGDLSNGLQHVVAVAVDNKPEGTVVTLHVGGRVLPTAPTQLVAAVGHKLASFDAVSLPEGDTTLRACAVDAANNVGCIDQLVHVSTGRPTCEIAKPVDGAFLGARDDVDAATAGVQVDVAVQTNAPEGSAVQLAMSGAASQSASGTVSNGTATVRVSFPAEGVYSLGATCTGASGVTGQSLANKVTVALHAPSITLDDPADGALLNLATADKSAAAGFQIDVHVSAHPSGSESTAGAAVKLTVSCGQGPVDVPAVALDASNNAVFHGVNLPDDASCDLTATLEDAAGNTSAPAVSHIRVDRVAPTIRYSQPTDGTLLGTARDADPATAGFQLDHVIVVVSGGSASATPSLTVGTTTVSGGQSTLANGGMQTDWALVNLQEGANTLTTTAVDDAGNKASSVITVTVDTHGPVVTIQSLTNNQTLTLRNDVDPTTGGLQVNVGLSGEKLVNGTTVRICSPQGTGTAMCTNGNGKKIAETILAGGSAVVPKVTLPEGTIQVYAEATDLALNTSPPSASVTLNVDSVPPKVVSLALVQVVNGTEKALDTQSGSAVFGPAQDSGTASGFQVRVKAKLSGIEAGKSLTAQLVDTNPAPGTVLGTAPIADDGSVQWDVTLGEGGHRLNVMAVDLAGNPVSTPENPWPNDPPVTVNFGVDLTPPALAIVSPVAGKLLAKDDADPTTPGLQVDVVLDSDAGAGQVVQLTVDGAAAAKATLPISGRRVTQRMTLPEGSHALSATVSDAAGNTASAGPVSLFVDSVAPQLAITNPAAGATISTDADPATDGFQITVTVTYGQVEAGQPLVVSSSVGGTLAQTMTDGSGSAQLTVTVPSGAQTLTAQATDASGNAGTSAGVAITIQSDSPSIHFVSAQNPMYFGQADGVSSDGQSCVVTIAAGCDTNGASAVLLVNGTAGAPVTVANLAASFGNVTIANGATVTLQLKATDTNNHTGFSASRQATCDLSTPSVSVTSPADGVKYVAYGNPGNVAGAVADKLAGAPLEADFTVQVNGANGGTVSVSSDKDGLLATQNVTSASATVTFTSVSVKSQGKHVLTFQATGRSGNKGSATVNATVDVIVPAAASATTSIVDGRRSVVGFTFTAPGDDAATGGPVAGYVVRRSDAAITDETTWANAQAVTLDPLTIAGPGTEQDFTVTGLAFEKTYHFAVRALDAMGNLGALSGKDASVDLHETRRHLGVPAGSNFAQEHLAIGDLDGDGKDDLVVSSASAQSSAGEVDIYYGDASLQSPTSCAQATNCVALIGAAGAHFGSAVAVGDVNGDGLADLLVGAEYTTAPGSAAGTRDGAVYVFLARKNSRLLATALADSILYGKLSASDPGTTITAGMGTDVFVSPDLSGDGVNDILVSSPYENGRTGKVYVFSGQKTWLPTYSSTTDALATLTAPSTIGANESAFFGLHVAPLGDLDGDGFADFAASAPFGTRARRPVFVISGKLARGTVVADSIAALVASPADGDRFGYDLTSADLTNDKKADLVISDSGTGTTGVVGYLVNGAAIGAALPTAPVAGGTTVPASATLASMPFLQSGFLLVRGLDDVNGDGIADFAGSVLGTAPSNDVRIWFGRAASAWPGSGAAVAPDVTILKTSDVRENASFGVRVGAGHVVSSGSRDIVVLDLGGTATVLSGP